MKCGSMRREKSAAKQHWFRSNHLLVLPCHSSLGKYGSPDSRWRDKLRDRIALRRHFRRVNRCQQIDFDRRAKRALSIYQRRSEVEWDIDCGSIKTWCLKKGARTVGGSASPLLSNRQRQTILTLDLGIIHLFVVHRATPQTP